MTGQRIRRLRESVGMSARELSRLAGLPSHTHVAWIESAPKGAMKVRTAVAIAGVLGCSLDWLLIGRGKAPSSRAVRAAVARARGPQAAAA